MRAPRIAAAVLAVLLAAAPVAAGERVDYAKDVDFALRELKKACGHFFKLKGVDWKAVEKEFRKEVREVADHGAHWKLLARLVARLRDGHASVRKLAAAEGVEWPDPPPARQTGPGMFWCRSGDRILVKNAWSAAADAGVRPGMQVLTVDDLPVERWIEAKTAERADLSGFSTDQQAFYATCHWGLAGEQGSPMKLVLRSPDGKRHQPTIRRRRASTVPVGPAVFPEGVKQVGRQSYGRTPGGFGYIHLRDVPGELPEQLDAILADLGEMEGLVLDFRANGGGGCDHEAVFGRFVGKGTRWTRSPSPIESAGEHPFAGPMVVVVDAGCRSAGETVSGYFKEFGRARMIGESPTAGMSSSKRTIELPSGLFALYVSVDSNMNRFNGGKGVEGIGVPPDEIVEYDAGDLWEGRDTLIRRADEILAEAAK